MTGTAAYGPRLRQDPGLRAMRTWAICAGYSPSDRGRLSDKVCAAYRAAQAMAVLTPDDPDLPEEGAR